MSLNHKINYHNSKCNTVSLMEACAREVKNWMDNHRLQMNASKLEFILMGSWQQLKTYVTFEICIINDVIKYGDYMNYLGVPSCIYQLCYEQSIHNMELIQDHSYQQVLTY